jgi:hypothetical protein
MMGGRCVGIPLISTRCADNGKPTPFTEIWDLAMKKIKGKCGDFGTAFAEYLFACIEKEFDANLMEYTKTLQPVTDSGDVPAMTQKLIDGLKTVNDRFNNNFPDLMNEYQRSRDAA